MITQLTIPWPLSVMGLIWAVNNWSGEFELVAILLVKKAILVSYQLQYNLNGQESNTEHSILLKIWQNFKLA